LRNLTALVGKVFQVPVAYAAMLGQRTKVMNRIGSGLAYSKYLKSYPMDLYLSAPQVVRDARDGLPYGADLGDLRFMASAPVKTMCGQPIGVLVVADLLPRPEFSGCDTDTLTELAGIVANCFELRMISSQSLDFRSCRDEAEDRFRSLANSVPSLIACTGPDGACEFVNDTWLNFTGRHLRDERGDGWCETMPPRHQERFLILYSEAMQTRRPFDVETPLRRRDGAFRWMRGRGTPRVLRNGDFAGFVLTLSDVSDYVEPSSEEREVANAVQI
jgi:PAS domain S-box-containing protein